jgi:hypothetical protein
MTFTIRSALAYDLALLLFRPQPRIGRRTLTDDDLLRLKLWYGVGSILSAERRKRLFETTRMIPK